jgi:hypothetical protein
MCEARRGGGDSVERKTVKTANHQNSQSTIAAAVEAVRTAPLDRYIKTKFPLEIKKKLEAEAKAVAKEFKLPLWRAWSAVLTAACYEKGIGVEPMKEAAKLQPIIEFDAVWKGIPNRLLRDAAGKLFTARQEYDKHGPLEDVQPITLKEAFKWFVNYSEFADGFEGFIENLMELAIPFLPDAANATPPAPLRHNSRVLAQWEAKQLRDA